MQSWAPIGSCERVTSAPDRWSLSKLHQASGLYDKVKWTFVKPKKKGKKRKRNDQETGDWPLLLLQSCTENLHPCACARKINGDVSGRSVWLNALLNATRVHRRVNQEDIDGTFFRGEIGSSSPRGAWRPHRFISLPGGSEQERRFLMHPAAGWKEGAQRRLSTAAFMHFAGPVELQNSLFSFRPGSSRPIAIKLKCHFNSPNAAGKQCSPQVWTVDGGC